MPRFDGITLAVMRLIWQLRCGYSAAAPRLIRHHLGGDAVNLAALPRLVDGVVFNTDFYGIMRISTRLCLSVLCFVLSVFFITAQAAKVSNLKVERRGLSPSALSRGLSVSATLGMQATKRTRMATKESVKSVKNRRSGVLLRRLACYYENNSACVVIYFASTLGSCAIEAAMSASVGITSLIVPLLNCS